MFAHMYTHVHTHSHTHNKHTHTHTDTPTTHPPTHTCLLLWFVVSAQVLKVHETWWWVALAFRVFSLLHVTHFIKVSNHSTSCWLINAYIAAISFYRTIKTMVNSPRKVFVILCLRLTAGHFCHLCKTIELRMQLSKTYIIWNQTTSGFKWICGLNGASFTKLEYRYGSC